MARHQALVTIFHGALIRTCTVATIGIKLYRTVPGSKGGESETELVVSSTAQGPPKNAIKIDVLVTDPDNRGRNLS